MQFGLPTVDMWEPQPAQRAKASMPSTSVWMQTIIRPPPSSTQLGPISFATISSVCSFRYWTENTQKKGSKEAYIGAFYAFLIFLL